MHKTLNMLSDRLCKDIDESVHEEKLTPATMEMLDKAVDIIKDIETIRAMENYGEDYGEDASYAMRRNSRGRNSYNPYDRVSYGRDSYGMDDASIIRRMDGMNEHDRKRLEDFIRQM